MLLPWLLALGPIVVEPATASAIMWVMRNPVLIAIHTYPSSLVEPTES